MRQTFRRLTSGFLAVVLLFGILATIPAAAAENTHHHHNFACFENYELSCDNSDHEHRADCYAYVGNLVCGMEEGEAHSHNEEGFECKFAAMVLVCDEQEHAHTEACLADGEALVEVEDDLAPLSSLPEDGGRRFYFVAAARCQPES